MHNYLYQRKEQFIYNSMYADSFHSSVINVTLMVSRIDWQNVTKV